MPAKQLRVVTLDLDDTLWPYPPIAARIAAAVGAFLRDAAPRTAEHYDEQALLRALTAPRETRAGSPEHQRWLVEAGLREELRTAGDDPQLAIEARRIAAETRQRVDLYPDAEPAIARLRDRFRVIALTNGSSDPAAIGIAHWFDGLVRADTVGVSKPDPRLFHHACAVAGVAANETLHAGDDLALDVRAALDAGLRAAWVRRKGDAAEPSDVLTVPDLLALASELGA